MTDSLLSPSWYRVAQLKPRIRDHAQFHRHRYRGQVWYVLQDVSTGSSHRLTPAAYRIAGLMDGERTTDEIWRTAIDQLGDEGPTQDETIHLLGLLHLSDMLRCDVSPDTAELFRRRTRRTREEQLGLFGNPLAIRIPLVDPDRFLERWLPWVQPIFSRAAAVVWCLTVATAVLLAGQHWPEISFGSARQLLEPSNLLVLWIVYPLVKAFHELGHAFATKVWGGEVHEMGILILVLFPIPYVDASAASAFPDKRKRMGVGAAGILVELFLASIAFLVWLAAEPGLVDSIAYNVMWIGGASTLLFNGNPLLKFDGYYVLADAIEIPNLGTRSTQYLGSLVMRHLLHVDAVREPVSARGEKAWFVGYGLAAFAYRLVILFVIALFVSEKFFGLGIALAAFAVAMQVVRPVIRQLVFLFTSPRLGRRRIRAIATVAGTVLALALLFFAVPVSLLTTAEGVVWLPEDAQVRAQVGGFVERVLVEPGAQVERGDPLVLTRDDSLEAEVAVLEAQRRELRVRHHAERRSDLVRAQITLDEIAVLEAELDRARERAGEGVIRSPATGRFVSSRADYLMDRFIEQGERVGYVMGPAVTTVRVVVPQADVALLRDRTESVELRLSSRVGEVLSGEIRRQVPAATDRLPSRALGSEGGGRLAVHPSEGDGLRPLETVFQFDVSLEEEIPAHEIGGRVYVRFDHGSEPLAVRAYRAIKRAFLRRADV